MILNTCSFCDIGLEREVNQDNVFCGADGESILAAVADGMGGHEHGERASGTICEMLRIWWRAYRETPVKPSFSESLQELENVIQRSNARIRASMPDTAICGSTLTLLWIAKERWALLSIGDSRCYLESETFWGKRLRQLSTDDVWENQEEVKKGYTRTEIMRHPNYGSLTKAVGAEDVFSCEKKEGRLKGTSVFLLCSDGVYRYCSGKMLKQALGDILKGRNMKECLEKIRQEAYRNGAPDNLSAAAVYVH